MSSQAMLDKLHLKDEKNLLIQCLPSSIEKQFAKLSYAKNVTPLLRSRKIDFALVFAVNQQQLNQILSEVFPALHDESKLWIAYPKQTSKIVSDLGRDSSWDFLIQHDYKSTSMVTLDHVWNAMRFTKNGEIEEEEESNQDEFDGIDMAVRTVAVPDELETVFSTNDKLKDTFSSLSFTNRKEYVVWIESAKKGDTRKKRIEQTVEKLKAGKKNPTEK